MSLLTADRPRGAQHLYRFLELAPQHLQAPAVQGLLSREAAPPPSQPRLRPEGRGGVRNLLAHWRRP